MENLFFHIEEIKIEYIIKIQSTILLHFFLDISGTWSRCICVAKLMNTMLYIYVYSIHIVIYVIYATKIKQRLFYKHWRLLLNI